MTSAEARFVALEEALLDGTVVSERLREALSDVEAAGLLTTARMDELEKSERRIVDSLALNFANLAGILHDQLIRLIVTIEEGDVKRTRRDQRNVAEALGLIEVAADVERMADMRNRIAHQYPRDPVRQQRLLSEIVVEAQRALGVFERVRRFREERYPKAGKHA